MKVEIISPSFTVGGEGGGVLLAVDVRLYGERKSNGRLAGPCQDVVVRLSLV